MSARKILVPFDFNKNEIQNAVLQVLASAPGSPVQGQIYYDSAVGRPMFRGAASWLDLTARANHTGTILAATVSDFDTQVRLSRLDQLAAPTASVSLNSQKITNLQDGVSAQDAVSYAQLQAVLNGRDFKESVRAATTVTGTLASAYANGSVIDGVTLATGDRILIKNQTTGSENGIYVVQAAGAPVRAADADTAVKLTASMSVMIEEGTVLADKQWTLTNNGALVIGTTALTFQQTGAGTSYTAGTGILLTSAVSIDTAVVTRKFAVSVGDGSATTIAVAHGLASLDVMVQVFENSTGASVECDVVRTSTTNVNLIFAAAPTAAQYRVVVQG